MFVDRYLQICLITFTNNENLKINQKEGRAYFIQRRRKISYIKYKNTINIENSETVNLKDEFWPPPDPPPPG